MDIIAWLSSCFYNKFEKPSSWNTLLNPVKAHQLNWDVHFAFIFDFLSNLISWGVRHSLGDNYRRLVVFNNLGSLRIIVLQYHRLDILYNRFLILYNWFNIFDHRPIILNYSLLILNNWIIVLYNSPFNLWLIFFLIRFCGNNVDWAHPWWNTGSNDRVIKTFTLLLNPVNDLAPLFLLLILLLEFHLFAKTTRFKAKFNISRLLFLLFVNSILVLLRYFFFIRKNWFFILILLVKIWIELIQLGNIWIGFFHGYFFRNGAFTPLIYDRFFNFSDVAIMIRNTAKLIFWLLTKILFLLIRLVQRDEFLLFLFKLRDFLLLV